MLRLVSPGNVPICPVFVLVLVPLVQCFAWSARAMYLFVRVRTRTGTPCTVLRLVSPGNVPICPCSYSYWYPWYSASLGQPGQCTYLPVFVLVLGVNRCTVCTVLVLLVERFLGLARAMYLFARVRTRTRTPLYPLYMPARVMHLPTRACARTVLVPSHYILYCTSCTINRRARVRIRTVVVPLHTVPCVYLLYRGLAWLVQVMCLLPVFVLVPCLYYYTVRTGNVCFTRFVLVPCCCCTLAQCVPCFYLLPVFVLMPCVYYCTVGPGDVCFTRFALVPCCGCTIAPRFVLAPCNSQYG